MDLTHHVTVPASVDDTWAAFARPDRLAACFPGASITSVRGDDFTGSVKVKLGPLILVYEGAGRYVKRDLHSHRLKMEFHGDDKRGHGTVAATVTAGFTAGREATEVEVHTDLTITGKPEQFGVGVISDANEKLLDQLANCLAECAADGSLLGPEPEVTESSAEADEPTVVLADAPDDIASGPELGPAEPTRSQSALSTAAGDQTPSTATAAPTPSAAGRPNPTAAISRPTPASTGQPPAWVPASNFAEADLEMLSRVLPPLLKRYWPFLGGAGVAAFVASKIASRKKKKKKKR